MSETPAIFYCCPICAGIKAKVVALKDWARLVCGGCDLWIIFENGKNWFGVKDGVWMDQETFNRFLKLRSFE